MNRSKHQLAVNLLLTGSSMTIMIFVTVWSFHHDYRLQAALSALLTLLIAGLHIHNLRAQQR